MFLYFLCFLTLKYSFKKSLSQGPLMPGRVRWYKVESGCNGLGAALEAKLTSKAKGPVPLFLRFRRLFSFGNPKYPRRAGYGVNYTIVFVYVCFSICVCVLTLVLSVYIMSFCVCLSTCVCLSMSDCSCSRRGWTDQPTSLCLFFCVCLVVFV